MPGSFVVRVSSRLFHIAIGVLTASILTTATVHDAAADGADSWKVVELAGQVEVKAPGAGWRKPAEGGLMPRGAAIRTGAGGRLVLDSQGDSVTVSPNSRMEIPDGPTGAGATNVKQSLGTLLFRINKRPAGRFRVATPYLAAVIKGTTFSVTVNDRGTALHVSSGAVEVMSLLTRRVALVRPGQTAVVSSRRGTPMTLTGGNGTKPPADRGTRRDGDPATQSEPARKRDGAARDVPAGAERASGGIITRAIGEQRIDVFEATGGLVGNSDGDRKANGLAGADGSGGAFGARIGRTSVSGAGAGSAVTGASAPKISTTTTISVPKAVTSAVNSAASATTSVQSTVNTVTNSVNLPGL